MKTTNKSEKYVIDVMNAKSKILLNDNFKDIFELKPYRSKAVVYKAILAGPIEWNNLSRELIAFLKSNQFLIEKIKQEKNIEIVFKENSGKASRTMSFVVKLDEKEIESNLATTALSYNNFCIYVDEKNLYSTFWR